MPIPFTCPHCGAQTLVADQYAGHSGPCAQCGKTITIPLAGQAFVPPAGQPYPQGSPPPSQSSSGGVWLAVALVIGAVVVLLCAGAFLLPLFSGVGGTREAARRSQCTNNLKQISLAMQNYHDVNKCFPPAVMTEKDGTPKTSWRVAILPYIEQMPLYQAFNQNESWDGPSNRALGGTPIPGYRCPSSPAAANAAETHYFRIVGPNTVGGQPNEAVKFMDITDGTSNTILVVEVTGQNVPWSEPADLTVEEFLALFDANRVSDHPGGFNAAMADGSVRFISYTIDRETLRNLLIRNDGKSVTGF